MKSLKYIIAIVGTLFLLGAIAYAIFFGMIFKMFDSPLHAKEIIKEEWDINRLRKVTLYKLGGNATLNPSLHVAICTTDENGNSGKEKEIFIADKSFLNENDLITNWKSSDTLLIKYQKDLRIFKKEPELTYSDSSLNFKIVYKEKP